MYQLQTFDVVPYHNEICFSCMRKMLDDPTLAEYVCLMKDCDAKYDLKDIREMYEQTTLQMVCDFLIQSKSTV